MTVCLTGALCRGIGKESKDDPPSGDTPRPPRSEPELIAACISGQSDAWDELFRRFGPDVLAGAEKALGERAGLISATSEDLAQEFWCDVEKNPAEILGGFDGIHPLGPWLAEVAFRHCCKIILRSKEVSWPGNWPIQQSIDLEELPEQVRAKLHNADLVERMLERLDSKPREIIQARFGLGESDHAMDLHELSKRLGWSRAKLCREILRILTELRIIGETFLDE